MEEQRKWWRRHPKTILTIFLCSTFAFFGAAGYAVWNGQKENEGICDSVIGLRKDLVDILNSQRGTAEKNYIKLGLDTKQLNKDYDAMLAKIGDRSCP